MNSPTVSLICSTGRPENWQGLYESIGQNEVSWELVMVGPTAPDWDLPDNIKYIQSNVKPAQCYEIAARNASGELLLNAQDDNFFTTERPLDKAVDLLRAHSNERVIVSMNMEAPPGWNKFYPDVDDAPIMPLCGLFPAKLWREIGGIDRRFIAVCWVEDFTMSTLALGGEIILSDVYVDVDVTIPDVPNSSGTILYDGQRDHDRALLDRLWSIDKQILSERTMVLEPFKDEAILTRSQHPQGRWRHNNALLNRVTTAVTAYKLRQWRSKTFGRAYRFALRNSPSPIRTVLGRMWADRKR